MNEIKFRAYDKQSKRMRAVNTIAFHYEGESFDFDNSRLPKVANLWGKDIIDDKDIIIHRDIEQVELMQYIGLKDKNGVDIYEGDIISAGYYKWKCKVVWDEECARFIGITNDKDVRIVYVDMIDNDDKSAVEVIGNIYENKELLEDSKQ